jgi:hypothetical protein
MISGIVVMDDTAGDDSDRQIIRTTPTSSNHQNKRGDCNHIQSSDDQNIHDIDCQDISVTEKETDEISNAEKENKTNHISENDKISSEKTIRLSDEEDGFIPLSVSSEIPDNAESQRSSKKMRSS